MTYIIHVTGGPLDSADRVQHTPQTNRIDIGSDIGQPRNHWLEFDSSPTMEEIEGPILFNGPQQDLHTSVFYAEDHSEEVGNARGVTRTLNCRACHNINGPGINGPRGPFMTA